ncbi:MAG: SGNH/GDSL hydrolase family protein [Bryobacter sp.]
MTISRRILLGAATAPLFAQAPTPQWTNARSLTVEGQGFADTKSPWDRLPARAEGVVRPEVWNLSRQPAGILVRFLTDATEIHAKWTLTNKNFASPSNTAVGSSGLDLYVKTGAHSWHWLGIGRPTKFPENTDRLIGAIPAGLREYAVYLPMHNPVQELSIGVPTGAELKPAPVRREKPIVFYGTSITHGSSASRPGMTHVSMLGRRFDRPVINLGFGGNGRLELEVARFLVELDAAVLVIDCLPNVVAAQVKERTVPLVEFIRAKHPNLPLLLVEDRTYQDAFLVTAKRERNDLSRIEFRQAYAQLLAKGMKNIDYLGGETLLGTDGEGTTDSSHPSDLGFERQANAFEPHLRRLLTL